MVLSLLSTLEFILCHLPIAFSTISFLFLFALIPELGSDPESGTALSPALLLLRSVGRVIGPGRPNSFYNSVSPGVSHPILSVSCDLGRLHHGEAVWGHIWPSQRNDDAQVHIFLLLN